MINLDELPPTDLSICSDYILQKRFAIFYDNISHIYLKGLKDIDSFWYYRKQLGLVRNELLRRGINEEIYYVW